jgi:hypothetical protein
MVQIPTPTVELLVTPSITVPVALPTAAPTVETGPTLAPITTSGCIPGEIEWTFPLNQDQISGIIEPRGTVNVANLGFYKYEFSLGDTGDWTAIAAGNQVRVDQPLGGSWNTTALLPGDYRLRLIVTDNQNGIFPACIISVQITGE